jgi:putative ABC transport system permease protein
MLSSLETPEHPATEGTQGTATSSVASDYFATIRMPLLAGHTFDEGSAERNEAIVSISLARQLWPNESPIGRRFRNGLPAPDGSREPWKTVIGVVPDMVQDLREGPARQAMYGPLLTTDPRSIGSNSVTLLVRLRSGVPASIVDRIAASIATGNSRPVITNVRESIDQSIAEPRFFMQVLATFAALGVLLAAIGLFGVISYSVSQRTREIGVRMTLGATRGSIASLVVGDGLRLAIIGITLGLAGASAATRLIQSLLYGVSRFDPLSFALGALLLLVVAAVACAVPMWRATAVDPVIAVRAE